MIYDEDDGQIDGDASGSVNFVPNTAQPWLRDAQPPWHLWGNSQQIDAVVQDSTAPQRTASPGQLVKISYNRPETWQWLFSAKMLAGPPSPVNATQVEVAFDLIVGVGRAAILLQPSGVAFDKAFEQYFFQWGPLGPFPTNVQLYTTKVLAPNRTFRTDPPFPDQTGNAVAASESASSIDQIVAQNLQLSCRVIALAPPGSATIGSTITVEVSAAFSPRTHVRPDWLIRGPAELQFPGSEIGGR